MGRSLLTVKSITNNWVVENGKDPYTANPGPDPNFSPTPAPILTPTHHYPHSAPILTPIPTFSPPLPSPDPNSSPPHPNLAPILTPPNPYPNLASILTPTLLYPILALIMTSTSTVFLTQHPDTYPCPNYELSPALNVAPIPDLLKHCLTTNSDPNLHKLSDVSDPHK